MYMSSYENKCQVDFLNASTLAVCAAAGDVAAGEGEVNSGDSSNDREGAAAMPRVAKVES